MWLSKTIISSGSENIAEIGKITLSSGNEVEASGSLSSRSPSIYSPFGVDCLPPSDENVLMLSASGEMVAVGTPSNTANLESGEIRFHSAGGANIVLKNDGSVIINGMKINRKGLVQVD